MPGLSGAVASEQKRASVIGTDILQLGGNAVDAIIATTIAVNTLSPFHSDLGGGGFAIIRESNGNYEASDFRHTAPVTMEFYQKGASTDTGGSAVAVPGQMRGLWELHQKYGKLPWRTLFEPSIKLAKEGQEMKADLRDFTTRECVPPGSDRLEGSIYEHDPEYQFLFRDGVVLPLGETLYRHGYAKTLEILADQGVDAFYEGDMAEAIVKVVRERGGLMSLEDLKDYQPKWVKPISAKFRDNTLWTIPAPASGAIWLSAMGILNQFEAAPQGSVLDYHRVTEVLRFAYGQRTELGDPAFVPGLEAKQSEWISPGTSAKVAKRLSDDHTFPPDYYKPPGVEIKEDAGTSNITAADETGLVVSITTTVGLSWGSKIIVPEYGFVLNDSMDDFSVKGRRNATGYEPTEANYVQPGKRPLSSSCPYIVENSKGEVVLAGGAAGGSTIISANVQVTRNVLDYDFSAQEALRANRLHNQVLPNVSLLERQSTHQGITVSGFSEEMATELEAKGHQIEWVAVNRSTPCAIKFLPGPKWEPAGDPRKDDSGGSAV